MFLERRLVSLIIPNESHQALPLGRDYSLEKTWLRDKILESPMRSNGITDWQALRQQIDKLLVTATAKAR